MASRGLESFLAGTARGSAREPQASCTTLSMTFLDRLMCWFQWVGARGSQANGASAENVLVRDPRGGVGNPPRLTVEDTVLDLSAPASEADLVAMVTKAVQSRRTTPSRLLKAMNERDRCKHRRLLADMLSEVAAGAESPLEMKFLHEVERPHGLPRGNRQQRRHGLRYISDVGYDLYRVLVELDGRTGHEGLGRFRDMNRDNQFAVIEWITLRYGWYDVVHRPCLVALQIAAALVARGWDGLPTRCRRCVNATDLDLCE